MMQEVFTEVAREFFADVERTCRELSEDEITQVISLISKANAVFVAAVGHSNMIAQVLTMKLNHLGKKAYQVFDIVNPPFDAGDLLIVVSQSGETDTLVTLARKAKTLGGKVLAFTSRPLSTIGSLSDGVLRIEVKHDGVNFHYLGKIGDVRHGNLSGALFGMALYTIVYALISILMERWGESAESFDARHANLQ
ncbi:MAG: SIS domain-containing protein [Candidatus Caldatribacteriaceae bacterium]